TVLHHIPDRPRVHNALQRILVEHLKVRELADIERPKILFVPDGDGSADRSCAQDIIEWHPLLREVPELIVRRNSEVATMGAHPDTASSRHHAGKELLGAGENFRAVPAGSRTA